MPSIYLFNLGLVVLFIAAGFLGYYLDCQADAFNECACWAR